MKKIIIALFFLSMPGIAQESEILNPKSKFYIYGDATCIGNNIVSEHATNNFDKRNVLNDEIKMQYVDIDNNASTFSSSAATLQLPKSTKKIVYAALYWSAIYSYEKGVKRKVGDKIVYKGNNQRDTDLINLIKFKTPNQDYQNVTGEVVFDGFEKPEFKDSAPYVCYADVTELINNTNYNGSYTVANIKATEGYISGGSSAGWLLYVVYENDSDSPKYINTYDGLVFLSKKNLELKLTDFETLDQGKVKASLTLAALEGDSRLKRDQCYIKKPTDSTYVPIFNNIRNEKNFFNSTITNENKLFSNRLPNSSNTLGFDLANITVPNVNNKIIQNHATETTLRFNTKADRLHLFFVAFKTEINKSFYNTKNNNLDTDIDAIVANPETISNPKTSNAVIRSAETNVNTATETNPELVSTANSNIATKTASDQDSKTLGNTDVPTESKPSVSTTVASETVVTVNQETNVNTATETNPEVVSTNSNLPIKTDSDQVSKTLGKTDVPTESKPSVSTTVASETVVTANPETNVNKATETNPEVVSTVNSNILTKTASEQDSKTLGKTDIPTESTPSVATTVTSETVVTVNQETNVIKATETNPEVVSTTNSNIPTKTASEQDSKTLGKTDVPTESTPSVSTTVASETVVTANPETISDPKTSNAVIRAAETNVNTATKTIPEVVSTANSNISTKTISEQVSNPTVSSSTISTTNNYETETYSNSSNFSSTDQKTINTLKRSKSLIIPDIEPGYYVITNVFSQRRLAEKWNEYLTEKGYITRMFVNPKNNWIYISIYNSEDAYQAIQERKIAAKQEYFEGIWVYKVNY